MSYIKVAETTGFNSGDKKKILLNGKEILIVNVDNAYYAIDNTCPHMGGSLYEGKLLGSHVVCPKHGSIFDVKTGRVVESGKLLFIKVKVHDINCYTVKVLGSDIMLEVE